MGINRLLVFCCAMSRIALILLDAQRTDVHTSTAMCLHQLLVISFRCQPWGPSCQQPEGSHWAIDAAGGTLPRLTALPVVSAAFLHCAGQQCCTRVACSLAANEEPLLSFLIQLMGAGVMFRLVALHLELRQLEQVGAGRVLPAPGRLEEQAKAPKPCQTQALKTQCTLRHPQLCVCICSAAGRGADPRALIPRVRDTADRRGLPVSAHGSPPPCPPRCCCCPHGAAAHSHALCGPP